MQLGLARPGRSRRRLGRRILLSLLMVAIGCTLLHYAQPAIEDKLEIGPMSYVSVGWTGFLLGNELYWLVAVSRFSRRLLRRRDLRLVWHSPASTPGIVCLSRGYTFATVALLFLALGVEALALRVSIYGDSPVLRTLAITFPVLGAAGALILGVLPHWWLYQVVRDARQRVLQLLATQPSRPPRTPAEIAETQGWISLYTIVESSPGLPFSTGWMVKYTAAVLSTLVGTLAP